MSYIYMIHTTFIIQSPFLVLFFINITNRYTVLFWDQPFISNRNRPIILLCDLP